MNQIVLVIIATVFFLAVAMMVGIIVEEEAKDDCAKVAEVRAVGVEWVRARLVDNREVLIKAPVVEGDIVCERPYTTTFRFDAKKTQEQQ